MSMPRNRKLLEDLLYRVRKMELRQRGEQPEAPAGAHRQGSVGALVADPSAVSVVIPAYNEADVIGEVVAALAASAAWHEIIVVDDGSRDGTGARATAAGATVVTHPYNKGNGAAVKSGIRRATGEFVLIIDGDGQHRPDDARRLVDKLGEYDLVDRRARRRHAGHAGRGSSATRC